MTEGMQWFDVPLILHQKSIATPILWTGDDRHYQNAKKAFGDVVFQDLLLKHRPYKISNVNFKGENFDFFKSKNYLIAKDRCLKMMDRLDLYGTFSRIDREAYFHNLIIWSLKYFSKNKPDFLLTAENPHGHAQYLIYQICLYLNIPIYKFSNWNLVPLLFLQNEVTKEIIVKSRNSSNKIYEKIDKNILNYIDAIVTYPEEFEFPYMLKQKNNQKFIFKVNNFFKSDLISYYKDIKHNTYMSLFKAYNPINPYKLNFFTRLYIKTTRKKNLRKSIIKFSEEYDLNKKFVYFSLHFEPERTTNPDGDFYHDQLIAILNLRSFLPKEVYIYIKEHPSQLFISERGILGRSPIFYKLLKNIYNVKFLSPNENSMRLIKKSIFTSSITGSVSLETALIGKKSIIFGSTWFDDCPNIYNWSEQYNFDEFMSFKTYNTNEIKKFLLNKRKKYSIPAFQNGSAMRSHSGYNDQEFYKNQVDEITSLIEDLIKTKFS